MDEIDLRQQVAEGKRFAELLADASFVNVLDKMEATALSDWRDADDPEAAAKTNAWMRLRVIDDFRAGLQSIVNTGQLAAHELEGVKRGQTGE